LQRIKGSRHSAAPLHEGNESLLQSYMSFELTSFDFILISEKVKKHLARFLIILVLLVTVLLPAIASAATVVVVRRGGYRYHGHNYRYHHHHHYYNHRVWVVARSGRPGYYRYW
jgi:hypothetical protein